MPHLSWGGSMVAWGHLLTLAQSKFNQICLSCLFSIELSTRTCENGHLSITCNDGSIIHIRYANYGRLDRTICMQEPILTDSCVAKRSLEIVGKRCNGLQKCRIQASNDVFGDPCVGTVKYLEVRYSCETGSFESLSLSMMALLAKVIHNTRNSHTWPDLTCYKIFTMSS